MIAIRKDAMRYRDPETGKFVGVSLIGGDAPSDTSGTPVEIDGTLTQSGKAADAKAVGDQLSALNQAIDALGKTGLTSAQVNALNGMFKVAAYIKSDVSAEYSAFKTAFGIEDSGEKPVEPEVTLTSISVAYSGGDVAVGTALSALTGIVVTASYSDGSTATVTDYTLSGEIVKGSNTITVSYGGKTATFTVTGIAESGGDEPVAGVLYSLPTATEFDGASTSIDTGVALTANDIDFTVAYTMEYDVAGANAGHVWGNQVDSYGYAMYEVSLQGIRMFAYGAKTNIGATSNAGNTNRVVCTHRAGSGILTTHYFSSDGSSNTYTQTYTWLAHNQVITLGCKAAADGTKREYWRGRLADFTIYDHVLSNEDITNYLYSVEKTLGSYSINDLTVFNGGTSALDPEIILYENSSTTRRSFVLMSGEKALKLNNNATDSAYYPIPIPSGARKVLVSIEPNTQYIGVAQYVHDSYADTYTKGTETGWVQSIATLALNSSSTHITVAAKQDSAGSSYTTEPTALNIVFY